MFDAKGGVGYTKRKPAGPNAPLGAAVGKGFWFESAFNIKICWTDTGTLEEFTFRPPLGGNMSGSWNGAPNVEPGYFPTPALTLPNVNSIVSRGMLVMKGLIIQPRPNGTSRVSEMDSHCS